MTQDNSTDNSLAGDQGSGSSDGGAAVASLTLAELNTYLGKDFKDTETALKALKDTQSFVGKRKEDIASEVRAELSANASSGGSSNSGLEATVKSLQEDLFYTQNPQYRDYADTIKAMGGNPAEVVQGDAFKKIFAKAQVADEVERKKSVVSSSSRLAQSTSAVETAVKLANARGSTVGDVAEALARSINEEVGQG